MLSYWLEKIYSQIFANMPVYFSAHWKIVCLTGEAASLDGRLVEVLVKISIKQISFLWFWDIFILLPSQKYEISWWNKKNMFGFSREILFYVWALENQNIDMVDRKWFFQGLHSLLKLSIADLFEKIVPIPVYDAMNVFEGRKSQITNMEIGRLREQTNLMNR